MSLPEAHRRASLRRKGKFAVVGLGGVAVSFGSLYLMIDVAQLNPSLAYAIQTVLALETNFVGNALWTWRDRDHVSFGRAWVRFHATRLGLMIPINQVVFWALHPLAGTLPANAACLALATLANWFLNDRLVFRAARPPRPQSAPSRAVRELPSKMISVVVPVKNSATEIHACVQSLLNQDYPNFEVIVVGDDDDTSWPALAHIADDRLVRVPIRVRMNGATRDANLKRRIGLARATGEVLAMTDSDMVLRAQWMADGARLLETYDIVASSMVSTSHGFLGQYIDRNVLGSRTPRYADDVTLTTANFGRKGHKPPVTANLFLRRAVLTATGGPSPAFTRSYEDYEWARRMVDAGFSIHCTSALASSHTHRTATRQIMRDYHRSGRGCADYVITHPHCYFARARMVHGLAIPMAALSGVGLVWFLGPWAAMVGAAVVLAVMVASLLTVRTPVSLLYPLVTLALGLTFWSGLVRQLVGNRPRLRLRIELPQLPQPIGELVDGQRDA